MEFTGVYHKTSEQMSYPLNEDELVVNLKTGYDVKRVFIHHGDPFEAGILGGKEKWTGKREEIVYKKRLRHQIWWTTTLVPPYKRCKYYFELHTDREVWYYCEDGFLTQEQMDMEGRMIQCFTVPWMNPADVNRTPDWVNDTVWYQIFPDRFCRGVSEAGGAVRDSAAPEGGSDVPWRTGPVTNEGALRRQPGGDPAASSPTWQTWGSPGSTSTPSWRRSPTTSMTPRTTRGSILISETGRPLPALVREAHALGIRVMVDAVFNHCGQTLRALAGRAEKREGTPRYADWFMVHQWPLPDKQEDTRDGRFYSFAFADWMPKLNTNNEEVIDYFCQVCQGWIRDFDIDGIRFDVGNEVSHRFLKKMREHLKGCREDIYLLGEIWHDASQWLMGDEYDSVMNYPLMSGIHDFFLDKSMKKEEFEYMINRCYTMYMQQNNNVMFNLLDSHDTERLMNRFHDLDIFYQQLAVLFTMPGSPCIYYGTEIAMEGGHDPDCRRCMPWDELEEKDNQEKIGLVRSLIRMRKDEEACRSLYFHFPCEYENDRCVEYIKLDGHQNEIEVLLNCSKEDMNVREEGEILFSRKYADGVLGKNGTLIRRKIRR